MSDPQVPSAFDRLQTRPPGTSGGTSGGWVVAGLVAALLIVGAIAWWAWPADEDAGDLLLLLTETADGFQPDVETTRPDEARMFVLETLGWSVTPPDLPGLAVVGVGLPSIGTLRLSSATAPIDIQVPAFRYEASTGDRAVLFAYDYILLDRVRQQFDLPEGTYAALSEPSPLDSRTLNGRFVISWRTRAMIFSAVTDSEAIAERIRQAVSV